MGYALKVYSSGEGHGGKIGTKLYKPAWSMTHLRDHILYEFEL